MCEYEGALNGMIQQAAQGSSTLQPHSEPSAQTCIVGIFRAVLGSMVQYHVYKTCAAPHIHRCQPAHCGQLQPQAQPVLLGPAFGANHCCSGRHPASGEPSGHHPAQHCLYNGRIMIIDRAVAANSTQCCSMNDGVCSGVGWVMLACTAAPSCMSKE